LVNVSLLTLDVLSLALLFLRLNLADFVHLDLVSQVTDLFFVILVNLVVDGDNSFVNITK